jgi:hypothetical protein
MIPGELEDQASGKGRRDTRGWCAWLIRDARGKVVQHTKMASVRRQRLHRYADRDSVGTQTGMESVRKQRWRRYADRDGISAQTKMASVRRQIWRRYADRDGVSTQIEMASVRRQRWRRYADRDGVVAQARWEVIGGTRSWIYTLQGFGDDGLFTDWASEICCPLDARRQIGRYSFRRLWKEQGVAEVRCCHRLNLSFSELFLWWYYNYLKW